MYQLPCESRLSLTPRPPSPAFPLHPRPLPASQFSQGISPVPGRLISSCPGKPFFTLLSCHLLCKAFPKSPQVRLSALPPARTYPALHWLPLHLLWMNMTTGISPPCTWPPKTHFPSWVLPLDKVNWHLSKSGARRGFEMSEHRTYQALIRTRVRHPADASQPPHM